MTDLSKRIRENLLTDPRGLDLLGGRTSLLREAADALEWKPIKDAPKDGTSVLLFTTDRGIIEGRFSEGYWSEDTIVAPAEYSGDAWVCFDAEIEIEVILADPDETGTEDDHGTVTHFMPLPTPPEDE